MEDQQITSDPNQGENNTQAQNNEPESMAQDNSRVMSGQSERQEVQAQPQTHQETPDATNKSEVNVPELLKKAQGQPNVSSEEKIWALVSYIPLVALMALVLKPSSEFIKLHGRQGLLIFLIFFFSIFVYLVPYIGALIGVIIHLGMIGIAVFSMYQAFIGNWWKIPVLGDIAELIPVDLFAKVTREAVMGEKVAEEIEQKSKEEEEAKDQNMNQQLTENKENQPTMNKPEENKAVSDNNESESGASQQQLPIAGEDKEAGIEENRQ